MAIVVKSVVISWIAAILVVVAIVVVFSVAFSSSNLSESMPSSLAERSIWLVVASLTLGIAMAIGLKPAVARPAAKFDVESTANES